jgi:hypothetical protein
MDSWEYARKYEASPPFLLKNTGTITAGSSYDYDFFVSSPQAQKYLPFNYLRIANKDASNDLELYINGSQTAYNTIIAGTIEGYDKSVLPAFTSIQLKNIGSGTIAIGSVQIFAQKQPYDTQTAITDAHRQLVRPKKVFEFEV